LNFTATRFTFFLTITLFILTGCAKKADTVAGPTDTGTNPLGAPVSTERRMKILDTLAVLDNSLTGSDHNADNQRLLALLRAQPEIARAGVSPTGAIWAVFTDRRVFIQSSSFDNTSLNPNASSAAIAPASLPLRKLSENLPSTKTATVLNALGSAFDKGNFITGYYGAEQTRQDIASFLTSAGYTVRPGNDASIDGLKKVNGDDAVFHITTHGERVTIVYDEKDSVRTYGIWTTDQVSAENDAKYKTELDAEELCIFRAPNTKGILKDIKETHYAITSKFVKHYMHFGKNSLIYITACSSSSDDAGLMIDEFGTAGASVYVGWTQPTSGQDSFYAARFFFDRVLGMNAVKPIPHQPQRPFEYYLVHEDMQYRKIDKTTAKVDGVTSLATLTFRPLKDDFIELLPTIKLGSVVDQTRLFIDGTYGNTPGVVKFNGNPLAIDPWKSSTLSMTHPQTGGLIWVEVNGLASNKLPLTEWDGTITYTLTGNGSLKQTVTLNLVLIADVHRFRVVSGADVIWPDIDFWGNFRGVYVSPKSSGAFTASGEYRDPSTHEVLESWTGGGSIALGQFPTLTTGFSALGMIDSVGGKANLTVLLNASYNLFTKQAGNRSAPISLPGGFGNVEVVVQPGFVLPPLSKSSGTAKFEWSGATPDPRYVQKPSDQR
jgi:hypothetical protein